MQAKPLQHRLSELLRCWRRPQMGDGTSQVAWSRTNVLVPGWVGRTMHHANRPATVIGDPLARTYDKHIETIRVRRR